MLKKIRKFICEKLDWHKPLKGTIRPISPNKHIMIAQCKYCGTKIMQDSQGNWFDIGK